MNAKIQAILSNKTGWSLIAIFVIAGLQALQSHLTGNVGADIGTVLAVIGLVYHPTPLSTVATPEV